ncbi:MAG: hypothetical protein JJ971_12335 [Balneolaceae bacterium]|nr:hypothetical protein [Balneolaceae bacterium]MBO6547360.1 hypothetical protein [Balneolaceae bacterium]MBO6647693.1 hypothetical protein [Balneolaceae bacterium]
MSYNTCILYTDNYPAARLEIILLDGKINEKISNRVFIATLPKSIRKQDLNYSSPDKPNNLEDTSTQAIQRWKRSFEFDFLEEDGFFKIAGVY